MSKSTLLKSAAIFVAVASITVACEKHRPLVAPSKDLSNSEQAQVDEQSQVEVQEQKEVVEEKISGKAGLLAIAQKPKSAKCDGDKQRAEDKRYYEILRKLNNLERMLDTEGNTNKFRSAAKTLRIHLKKGDNVFCNLNAAVEAARFISARYDYSESPDAYTDEEKASYDEKINIFVDVIGPVFNDVAFSADVQEEKDLNVLQQIKMNRANEAITTYKQQTKYIVEQTPCEQTYRGDVQCKKDFTIYNSYSEISLKEIRDAEKTGCQ